MTSPYFKDPALNLFSRADFTVSSHLGSDEAENRIYAAVIGMQDRGTFSSEIAAAISDWPSQYHLSKERHCLLRPLDIKPGDRVLELGCGCGALTRYLGEIGASVTAVERLGMQARIAAERCADLPNVEVFAEELLKFTSTKQFDWVLLIGSLKYTPVFSDEADPTKEYLKHVARWMTPEGRLVVAVENKLGLKYFNGLSEDHLGAPFIGIQGLYRDKTARTFGREELKAELAAAGFPHASFQYPFPDYKLPKVILTDAALADSQFNPVDLLALIRSRDYSMPVQPMFDEALALREIARNGLLGDMSNSFLVVASRQADNSQKGAGQGMLATSFAIQRVPEFATQTRFLRKENVVSVQKEALFPSLNRRRTLADGSSLENKVGGAEYSRGELVVWKLITARAHREGLKQIVEALAPWFDLLIDLACSNFVSGKKAAAAGSSMSSLTLPGDALDLIPFNLIDAGDSLVPIDQEWKIDRNIPVGWVVTRGVLYALTATPGFEASSISVVEAIRALAARYDITVSDAELSDWLEIEATFQEAATGQRPERVSLDQRSSRVVTPSELRTELAKSSDLSARYFSVTARSEEIEEEITKKNALLSDLHRQVADQRRVIHAQRQDILDIRNSRSWRITAPLRALHLRLPYRIISFLRRHSKRLTAKLRYYRSRRLIEKSPLFSADWYLQINTDVRKAGADPIRHFLLYGANERRSPSPSFDTAFYLAQYPDVASAGVNPLVHYLRHGKEEGRKIRGDGTPLASTGADAIEHLPAVLDLIGSGGNELPSAIPEITVVVPVYNGFAHLQKLLPSLEKNTDRRHKIILVNDASPDPEILPYLEKWTRENPNARIVSNESNQGFVRSVNTGASAASGHFVILNTDTEVPPGWLERIVRPILDDPSVASATPFSNSATIFSFPKFAADNEALNGFAIADIDAGFRSVSASDIPLDAPTGVGFCMAINIDVWRKVGGFDQEAFPKGYGEENDWCQRAIAAGYRNVLTPNLFVYHAHGGSFTSAQKAENSRHGLAVVNGRWPGYLPAVHEFIAQDPWHRLRQAALVNIFCAMKPLVIVDHMIGGGANDYRYQLENDALEDRRPVGTIVFDVHAKHYVLNIRIGTASTRLIFNDLNELLRLPPFIAGANLVYNNLVSWPDARAMVGVIQQWIKQPDVNLTVLFHDYFPICPSYNLLNRDTVYCGVPTDISVCNECLPGNRNTVLHVDMRVWRKDWGQLMNAAGKIVFFSQASADIAARAYSFSRQAIEIRPHRPVVGYAGRQVQSGNSSHLVIGIVGSLNVAKGAGIVRDLCVLLAKTSPNVKVVVIGVVDMSQNLSFPNLTIHGRYDRNELPDILESYGVSVCVLPSIVPETFSYVTQELMELGMPLVCFDLGAPAERVRGYRRGRVAKSVSAKALLAEVEELVAMVSLEDSL